MLLDSGELTVWKGTTDHTPGDIPREAWLPLLRTGYGERTVGVNRFYIAKQQGDNPSMVVRISRVYSISPAKDLVTLAPYSHAEPGVFRILQVQQVDDEDGLPATDLTLERKEGLDADSLEAGLGGFDI